MGRLREVVEKLKVEYARTKKKKYRKFSKVLVRKIIQQNDATRLESKAQRALDSFAHIRFRSNKKELALRAEHPGLFDVVFINKHTKEKQVLTRKKGIPYDVAIYYYNYITYYGEEKYNDLGSYELIEHPVFHLPEESHFGIH